MDFSFSIAFVNCMILAGGGSPLRRIALSLYTLAHMYKNCVGHFNQWLSGKINPFPEMNNSPFIFAMYFDGAVQGLKFIGEIGGGEKYISCTSLVGIF